MTQICFDRKNFYLYTTVALVIIAFVLYSIHSRQLENARDHLKEVRREFKEAVRKQDQQYQDADNAHTHQPLREMQQMAHNVQHHEDAQRMFNPFVPPVNRGSLSFLGALKTTPVNTPTRGEYGSFQQMGYLQSEDESDHAMPLMGRRIHSNQWEYYTFHHNNPNIKIPLKTKYDEIRDDSKMNVPGYSSNFTVKIYNLDHPRYIPY